MGTTTQTRAAYSLEEARQLLGGIARQTLYAMRDRGEIRFCKIGRRSMIPADEIRRLVGESTTNDTDSPTSL